MKPSNSRRRIQVSAGDDGLCTCLLAAVVAWKWRLLFLCSFWALTVAFTEILTTVGLLYLRLGENYRAFDFLGNSLTHDPKNPKVRRHVACALAVRYFFVPRNRSHCCTVALVSVRSQTILAAGSIIQDHSDMDVALVKYRVAAVQTPNSAQLWNNIGMCFFGKQRFVAAIACLKRALYLDPFEWIISYNLGLVHLNTGQYASAFHYFSASINLKPDFPSSYMYLAITLRCVAVGWRCTVVVFHGNLFVFSRLDDFENACSAYEKAIEMERCTSVIDICMACTTHVTRAASCFCMCATATTCFISTTPSRCTTTRRPSEHMRTLWNLKLYLRWVACVHGLAVRTQPEQKPCVVRVRAGAGRGHEECGPRGVGATSGPWNSVAGWIVITSVAPAWGSLNTVDTQIPCNTQREHHPFGPNRCFNHEQCTPPSLFTSAMSICQELHAVQPQPPGAKRTQQPVLKVSRVRGQQNYHFHDLAGAFRCFVCHVGTHSVSLRR